MRLSSFKLHFAETHVWIMPAEGLDGRAFIEAGVDLRAADARAAFDAAQPMLTVLEEVEPGIAVRSLSLDLGRGRLLATLHDPAARRPRVVRVDRGPLFDRLLLAAGPLCELLATLAQARIAARPR